MKYFTGQPHPEEKEGTRYIALEESCVPGWLPGDVVTLVKQDGTYNPFFLGPRGVDRVCSNWKNFKRMEKTMENLQVGDVVEYNRGWAPDDDWADQTVLAVLGSLVALSASNDANEFGEWYTVKALKADEDYRVKTEEESVKEMTVADVEKLVGAKVKIVKE